VELIGFLFGFFIGIGLSMVFVTFYVWKRFHDENTIIVK